MTEFESFSEKLNETQQLVQLAIEQCKEIKFITEKGMNLYDEMLQLLDKLIVK